MVQKNTPRSFPTSKATVAVAVETGVSRAHKASPLFGKHFSRVPRVHKEHPRVRAPMVAPGVIGTWRALFPEPENGPYTSARRTVYAETVEHTFLLKARLLP